MVKAKTYPKYKDSGAPWIGKVPECWDVLPNRTLFYEIKERGHIDEQLISVTISQGVIRQSDLLSNSSKKDSSNEDKSKYKLVEPGDLAYNKMRAWQGAVGVSQYRGIVSPAYIVVRPRCKQNAKYFHYLLRTPAFAREAERWSYGITSDQWSLRPEHFKMIYCPVPSAEEQEAIVGYLDAVNKIIRKYIREKQEVIKLLNEQKQAIINKAVTRGIDPNVRLKSSGVEWLGDIPKHWEVRRLKTVIILNDSGCWGSDFDDNGTIILRSTEQTVDGCWRIENPAKRKLKPQETSINKLRAGDIVITKSSGSPKHIGKASLVTQEIEKLECGFSNFMQRIRMNKKAEPEFIWYILNSNIGRDQFVYLTTTTTGLGNLSGTVIGNVKIALPPLLEQQRIVNFAKHQHMPFNNVISRIEEEINLIRQYRTRIISDVVTGKIDVRNIELPEIEDISEPEPIDEQEIPEDMDDTEEVVNADE